MLLTRWHGTVGRGHGVPVRALVPLLEPAGHAGLAFAVPAVMAVVPPADERADQGEEEEQAEDREQEAEREESEAPAVRVPVVRDGRCGSGRGDDDLRGTLREAGFVGADGDRTTEDEDEDRGEKTSHVMTPCSFRVALTLHRACGAVVKAVRRSRIKR